MILHTILPIEEVLRDRKTVRPARYTRFSGGLIEIGENRTVGRVISTDPASFLKAELAPGRPLPKGKSQAEAPAGALPTSPSDYLPS